MANFLLEGRNLTLVDANQTQQKGVTGSDGTKTFTNVAAGEATITDDQYADITTKATVVSNQTAEASLDYTSKATIGIPVKVVRKDGTTPLSGVDVDWRNFGRPVPTKTAKTGADGKCTIAGCLPGGADKNDVHCEVGGKPFVQTCEIKTGMDEVVIKTDAPLDAGSIHVTCFIKAGADMFQIVR